MVFLFAHDVLASIPTLLRSIIDSLFDLKLLHQDAKNIGYLNAKALSETIKRFRYNLILVISKGACNLSRRGRNF